MPQYIYPSERVLPYVYYGVHKTTGQFYFGSRYGQKCYIEQGFPSHIDFGTYYFTSSAKVKELGFKNFDWIILAEFLTETDATYFENKCIDEHWKNPLLLNGHKSGSHFIATPESSAKSAKSRTGLKAGPYSDERKQNMRKPKSTTEGMKGPDPIVECPHCGKTGGHNIMKRWHFSHCKLISNELYTRPLLLNERLSATLKAAEKLECPCCGMIMNKRNAKQFHFDKCRFIPLMMTLVSVNFILLD